MPHMLRHPRIPALAVFTAAFLWLAGCATAPTSVPAPSTPASSAERQQSGGDFQSAARLWEQAATESADPAQANRYRLYAADAWWRAEDAEAARDGLEGVSEGDLVAEDAARLALLRGEMALAAGDALEAEFFLSAAGSALDAQQRGRLRLARQTLADLQADPGAQSLAAASSLLRDMREPNALQGLDILRQLEAVPSTRLQERVSDYTRIGQWAALSLDLRQVVMSGDNLLGAAERWAATYPRSEIDQPLYLELAWQYGQRFLPPARIAVLLPTTGNLSAASGAIRDGLVAALVARPGGAEVEFVPLAEGPDAAVTAFNLARSGETDWLIGPLGREAVQAVVDRAEPAPVLLLNRHDAAPSPNGERFSLALDQQEEAGAVARLMASEGRGRVLLLVSDNAWGARTEYAFAQALEAAGGEVVAREVFAVRDADHSERLTGLLQIADSRARKDALQSSLGCDQTVRTSLP